MVLKNNRKGIYSVGCVSVCEFLVFAGVRLAASHAVLNSVTFSCHARTPFLFCVLHLCMFVRAGVHVCVSIRVSVAERQAEISGRPKASLDDILTGIVCAVHSRVRRRSTTTQTPIPSWLHKSVLVRAHAPPSIPCHTQLSITTITIVPILDRTLTADEMALEVELNTQAILGYVVRW